MKALLPPLPDYAGGSLLNLMATLARAGGAAGWPYAPLRVLPPRDIEDARTLILVVLDGLGSRYLLETLPRGLLARHLLAPTHSVLPSTTASAITTLMTGLPPAAHGLTGWFLYFARAGAVVTTLRARPRAGGKMLDAALLAELYGAAPLYPQLARACHVVQPRHLIGTPYTRALARGAALHGYTNLAGLMDTLAALARADGPPRYVYAYWPELDRLGHEHGMHSTAARAHLRQLDGALDGLAQHLEGTGSVLLVTGDHGFEDVPADGRFDPTAVPELATLLTHPLAGESRFAFCHLRPGSGEEFARRIGEQWQGRVAALPGAALRAAGHYGPGPVHPALAQRTGECVLLPAPGCLVKDRVAGEPAFAPIGVHGGATPQELEVPLVALRP